MWVFGPGLVTATSVFLLASGCVGVECGLAGTRDVRGLRFKICKEVNPRDAFTGRTPFSLLLVVQLVISMSLEPTWATKGYLRYAGLLVILFLAHVSQLLPHCLGMQFVTVPDMQHRWVGTYLKELFVRRGKTKNLPLSCSSFLPSFPHFAHSLLCPVPLPSIQVLRSIFFYLFIVHYYETRKR